VSVANHDEIFSILLKLLTLYPSYLLIDDSVGGDVQTGKRKALECILHAFEGFAAHWVAQRSGAPGV
jgi:hypothetical protein